MLTAFTRKILELGTNRAKMGAGRTVNHMDQNFCMLTKRIVVPPSRIFLPPSKQPLGFLAIATDEITEASSEKGLTA